MGKPLWIVLAILFTALLAPNALADCYTPTFKCTRAYVSVPRGSDVAFSLPRFLTIAWKGTSFNYGQSRDATQLRSPTNQHSRIMQSTGNGQAIFTSADSSLQSIPTLWFPCPACTAHLTDAGSLSFAPTTSLSRDLSPSSSPGSGWCWWGKNCCARATPGRLEPSLTNTSRRPKIFRAKLYRPGWHSNHLEISGEVSQCKVILEQPMILKSGVSSGAAKERPIHTVDDSTFRSTIDFLISIQARLRDLRFSCITVHSQPLFLDCDGCFRGWTSM